MERDEMDRLTPQEMLKRLEEFLKEVRKNVFGQDQLLEAIVISFLADMHLLAIGDPGTGKTHTMKTCGKAAGVKFGRIQMTPDLLPLDITGADIYNQKTNNFEFRRGPLHGKNIVLIDELNRGTSKVQSALFETMAERQITSGNNTHAMEELFLILATMNRPGQAGTFELPEAQVDRFGMAVLVGSPSRETMLQVLNNEHVHGRDATTDIKKVITVSEILSTREHIKKNIQVVPAIKDYIANLVDSLNPEREAFKTVKDQLGEKIAKGLSGSRPLICMLHTARVKAFLEGREYVNTKDVKDVAPHVLRHRIQLTREALMDDFTADDAIDVLLKSVPCEEGK